MTRMNAVGPTCVLDLSATLFVAIELSRVSWLVAVSSPSTGRTGRHKLRGGDVSGLLGLIERRAQQEVRALGGREVTVVCSHEAGYDAFWLHRCLEAVGHTSYVIEPASLQVDRRARRAKTDSIDVEMLLRTTMAFCRGEPRVCSMVRPPTIAQEDARRTHRERKRLICERVGHVNRIKGLLATQGIFDYRPLATDRRVRLSELTAADGGPLPPCLERELRRELDRLELVLRQIAEVEGERDAAVVTASEARPAIATLMHLKGIGPEIATVLTREVFYRAFNNRREVAAFAGLTPSPFRSGRMDRDQGISKAGNPLVRTTMVELAWLWLRHQAGSALSGWYRDHFGSLTGRRRRIGIVALARKLLIALWRYVTTGLVPRDAFVAVPRN